MGRKAWLKLALVLCGICYGTEAQAVDADSEIVCGEELPSGEGTFSVPTQECGNGSWAYQCYSKNFECQWTIDAPQGHIVMLYSDDFDLETSENCVWDYVEVLEGNAKSGTKHCGWVQPLIYISSSNKLTINFKSDETYQGSGFIFHYTTYVPDAVTSCNTSIVGGPNGKIYNVEESDSSCFYSIEAPEGQAVELTLKMIDFGSNECSEERLVVHSGLTSQGEVLKKWCSDHVAGEVLWTKSRAVFIEYLNVIGNELERFMIEYKFLDYEPEVEKPLPPSEVGGDPDCSGLYKTITDDSGILHYTAPMYTRNKHCIVVVRNTMLEKGVIQVTFTKFHLEEIKDCSYDFLRVLSGERNTSQRLGGPYCGKSLKGRTFVTYGNSLRLEFTTDNSLSWFGYNAEISIVPQGRCDVCKRGVCVLQGYEKLCIEGKQCKSNTCENGGTCVETSSSNKCYCPPGFSGGDCSTSQTGLSVVRFNHVPKNMKVKKGSDLFPLCQANGTYEYLWLLNGEMIGEYNSKTKFGSHKSGTLQIDDISEEHEGMYTCIAKTKSGSAEHTFEITLAEDCDVEFTERPQGTIRRIGDNIMFTCSAKNAKHIHWKKAGLSGAHFTNVDVGPTSRFTQQKHTNYLIISNAQVEDAGVYRCIAEDARGCYSHREANLKILKTKGYNKYCGISEHDEDRFSGRIVGGENARKGENPWHIMIRTNFKNKRQWEQLTFCGGSLISKKYVLTAAHCVEEFHTKKWNKGQVPFSKASVELLFGSTNCKKASVKRYPERVIVHPDFNKTSYYDSDIAIIELDTEVDFGRYIRPICLENDKNIETMFFHDSSRHGRVAGCGMMLPGEDASLLAKSLQTVHLPFVSEDLCEERVEEYNYDHPERTLEVTDNMICAGFWDKDKSDTCGGDSGGAYIMYSNDQWFQTGIVSWGPKCGKSDMVGFYTHVGNFFSWIKQETDFTSEKCDDCKWGH